MKCGGVLIFVKFVRLIFCTKTSNTIWTCNTATPRFRTLEGVGGGRGGGKSPKSGQPKRWETIKRTLFLSIWQHANNICMSGFCLCFLILFHTICPSVKYCILIEGNRRSQVQNRLWWPWLHWVAPCFLGRHFLSDQFVRFVRYKGRCHLRFSGIRPLRGYPPPS